MVCLRNNITREGFTLIETIIYSVLVGITVTGFITFALLIVSLKNKNNSIEEVNANARTALNLISRKIREAESVTVPTFGNSSTALGLLMPGGENLNFSISNGLLILDEDGSVLNITSDETVVSSLNFTNLGSAVNDNIRFTFTLSYKEASSMDYNYSKDFQTAASLRR